MSTKAIDPSAPNTLVIEPTHQRQTQRPATPFRDVLASSVSVLTSGVEVATSIVGGPIVAAAVHSAGSSLSREIAGQSSGLTYASGVAVAGSETGAATNAALTSTNTASGGTDMAQMQAMQKESQVFNLQLLQLQENVQNENRHFTTVSNLLRASHDTAKAAISNVRS